MKIKSIYHYVLNGRKKIFMYKIWYNLRNYYIQGDSFIYQQSLFPKRYTFLITYSYRNSE